MNSPAIPIAFCLVAIFCASFMLAKVVFWLLGIAWHVLPWAILAAICVWAARRLFAAAGRGDA